MHRKNSRTKIKSCKMKIFLICYFFLILLTWTRVWRLSRGKILSIYKIRRRKRWRTTFACHQLENFLERSKGQPKDKKLYCILKDQWAKSFKKPRDAFLGDDAMKTVKETLISCDDRHDFFTTVQIILEWKEQINMLNTLFFLNLQLLFWCLANVAYGALFQ